MNQRFSIKYLSGGAAIIGPNYGSSIVQADIRSEFGDECPNIKKLLKNIEFVASDETAMMTKVETGEDPGSVALNWLQAHPDWLIRTLDGVLTIGGQPGLPAVRKVLLEPAKEALTAE